MSGIAYRKINSDLVFHNKGEGSVIIENSRLALAPFTCQLDFEVNWEIFKQIEDGQWLNLMEKMRGQPTGDFQEGEAVHLTAVLNPEYFEQITASGKKLQKVESTLLELSGGPAPSPVMYQENWMIKKVEQTIDGAKAGYDTLWNYINLANLATEETEKDGAAIGDAIVDFVKHEILAPSIKADLPDVGLEDFPNLLLQIAETGALSGVELNDDEIEDLQKKLNSALKEGGKEAEKELGKVDIKGEFDQILQKELAKGLNLGVKNGKDKGGSNIFSNLIQDALEESFSDLDNQLDEEDDDDVTMLDILVDFLDEEGWKFQLYEETEDVYFPFKGKNGRWHCFAQIKDEVERFVFYSLCPERIPEEKRPLFMEWVTRANWDMIIGNFELSLDSGLLRFKTSIDVENDGLSVDLVRNHVYVNVQMMDQYLPGILKLLSEDKVLPEAIIKEIEG
ncbi:MAG: YbjN domain-containing protein [Bacteroidota bacterium]